MILNSISCPNLKKTALFLGREPEDFALRSRVCKQVKEIPLKHNIPIILYSYISFYVSSVPCFSVEIRVINQMINQINQMINHGCARIKHNHTPEQYKVENALFLGFKKKPFWGV